MKTNNVVQIGGASAPAATTPSDLPTSVREAIATAGITQASAARQIGISAPVLTQWLAGTYAGDNAGVAAKASAWMASREARARAVESIPNVPEFLPTESSETVRRVLSYTHQSADIGMVYGAAGMGKTTALRMYAKASPNVWIATMTPATAGLVSALEEVASATGAAVRGSGAAALHRSIVTRLRGSGGLLVIDEAQHLCAAALDQVRAIGDAAGVGVALVGNEGMFYRVSDVSAAAFAQLASRIGQRVRLARVPAVDVVAIATAYGIHTQDARNAALRIAREPGALRAVTKALRLAHSEAQGEEVTGSLILAAAAKLRGDQDAPGAA